MIKPLLLFFVCLSVVPAVADDPAQANRLLVEAVKLIQAAETEDEASDKLALLEGALAKLNEIIKRHPSSSLAVKLITDQPIGSLSLQKLTDTVEKLRIKVARQQQMGEKAVGGPYLAAVSRNTNFLLQIDFARLAETPLGQKVHDVYRRYMEMSASEAESRAMEVLSTHLQGTVQVVLAADLSQLGEKDEIEQFANEVVLQFSSEEGFDVATLMQALGTLRVESGELRVEEVVSQQQLGYGVSLPNGGDRFYVLPSPDNKLLFVGLRLEPLMAALERYISGEFASPENLLRPREPETQISLSAVFPRSLRERLKNQQLLEQFSQVPELPLSEILGSVFEVGQVLVEAAIDRHVALEFVLNMDTTMSANVFFVMGNTLVLPALKLLDEGLFVSDPVLELEDLRLLLRFGLDGDMLLNWFETSLNDHASAGKPGALTQNQIDEDEEQTAIEPYVDIDEDEEQRAIQSYFGVVFQKLENHKRYPRIAERSGLNGRVLLRFTVLRNGEVIDPEVVEVTGHDSFRDAALRGLARVGQLPPFPAEIRRRELLMEVPLTYSISER